MSITGEDLPISERLRAEDDFATVEEKFLPKAQRLLGKVPFVPDAVAMYYALRDLETPFWVKAIAASALVYFISPVDAVPDVFAMAGYVDDSAILYAALRAINEHVTEIHKAKARQLLRIGG